MPLAETPAYAPRIVASMVAQPEPITFNVNVPGVAPTEVRGSRRAKIDEFGHFNVASQDEDGTAIDLGSATAPRSRTPSRTPRCASRPRDLDVAVTTAG